VRDDDGRLFVDRDADLFRIILNFVRSKGNDIYLPSGDRVMLKRLLCEAEYYGWYSTGNMPVNLFESCVRLLRELNASTTQQQQSNSSSPFSPSSGMSNSSSSNGSNAGSNNNSGSGSGGTTATVLLRMCVFNSNAAIANFEPFRSTSGAVVVQNYQHIPYTSLEFELAEDSPVVASWYFGDCAGEFAVLLDGHIQPTQPALCGILLENLKEPAQFDYATNAFIKHVQQCKKGKHRIELLWKSYKNCRYQLQGPVISEVHQINPAVCRIIGEPST